MWPITVILLFCGVALVIAGRKAQAAAQRASKWPTVIGQLDSCEVVERRGIAIEDPSTWDLQIRYSYTVHGVTYHSDRYAFGGNDNRDDQEHRAVAAALKRGPLVVHYDPAHPSQAVLNVFPRTYLIQLGYGCLASAAVCLFITLLTC